MHGPGSSVGLVIIFYTAETDRDAQAVFLERLRSFSTEFANYLLSLRDPSSTVFFGIISLHADKQQVLLPFTDGEIARVHEAFGRLRVDEGCVGSSEASVLSDAMLSDALHSAHETLVSLPSVSERHLIFCSSAYPQVSPVVLQAFKRLYVSNVHVDLVALAPLSESDSDHRSACTNFAATVSDFPNVSFRTSSSDQLSLSKLSRVLVLRCLRSLQPIPARISLPCSATDGDAESIQCEIKRAYFDLDPAQSQMCRCHLRPVCESAVVETVPSPQRSKPVFCSSSRLRLDAASIVPAVRFGSLVMPSVAPVSAVPHAEEAREFSVLWRVTLSSVSEELLHGDSWVVLPKTDCSDFDLDAFEDRRSSFAALVRSLHAKEQGLIVVSSQQLLSGAALLAPTHYLLIPSSTDLSCTLNRVAVGAEVIPPVCPDFDICPEHQLRISAALDKVEQRAFNALLLHSGFHASIARLLSQSPPAAPPTRHTSRAAPTPTRATSSAARSMQNMIACAVSKASSKLTASMSLKPAKSQHLPQPHASESRGEEPTGHMGSMGSGAMLAASLSADEAMRDVDSEVEVHGVEMHMHRSTARPAPAAPSQVPTSTWLAAAAGAPTSQACPQPPTDDDFWASTFRSAGISVAPVSSAPGRTPIQRIVNMPDVSSENAGGGSSSRGGRGKNHIRGASRRGSLSFK